MMIETLVRRAEALATVRRAKIIARILAAAPPNVQAHETNDGVDLRGRRLRLRFIRDAALRNFWR